MDRSRSERGWAGLILALATCAFALTARAAEPPLCTTGTYQTDEPPLLPAGNARISMRDGMIHLEGCSAVAAALRADKKGVRISAAWGADQCPGIGKVRQKARADTACTTLRGAVKAKRYRKSFVADAVSRFSPQPTIAQVISLLVLKDVI